MCVVMASVAGKRINEDWLAAGWQTNDHGAGVAWREGEGKKKVVRWKKGLMTLEELLAAYREIPEGIPHVAHMRISSVGPKCRELTHPFVLDDEASLDLEGTTRGALLFHNGHYNRWKEKLEDMAMKSGGTIKIPAGFWSDTRAMAYLAHKLGKGMLGFFEEKLVYFSPDRFDIYGANHAMWTMREGIHLSNVGWDWRLKRDPQVVSPSGNSTVSVGSNDRAAVSQAVSEVTADKRPFRKARVAVLQSVSGEWIQVPPGMSNRQRKRWRKRLEKQGIIPKGAERHAAREAAKYLEQRRAN